MTMMKFKRHILVEVAPGPCRDDVGDLHRLGDLHRRCRNANRHGSCSRSACIGVGCFMHNDPAGWSITGSVAKRY